MLIEKGSLQNSYSVYQMVIPHSILLLEMCNTNLNTIDITKPLACLHSTVYGVYGVSFDNYTGKDTYVLKFGVVNRPNLATTYRISHKADDRKFTDVEKNP